MEHLERCFKGLADRSRLRIVNLLLHGELCGCDVQYVLGAAQPNVSRHLTYLKHAGLVTDRRDGFRVFYRLSDCWQGDGRYLLEFLRSAARSDHELRGDVRALKQAIRAGACTASQFRPYAALVQLKPPGARP